MFITQNPFHCSATIDQILIETYLKTLTKYINNFWTPANITLTSYLNAIAIDLVPVLGNPAQMIFIFFASEYIYSNF